LTTPDPILADPFAVQKELRLVRSLMQLEQKEDHAQFLLKNTSASIKERRQRGITWYPITITQVDIGFGGKVVLELARPEHRQELHLFQVGSNASLFSESAGHSPADRLTLNGVITRVRRNKLTLATTKDALPEWAIDGSMLGIDLTFDEVSYREMSLALTAVITARDNRLAELRDVLLGCKPARYHQHTTDDLFYPSVLNDSQRVAVQHVIGAQDVAIIHGPPGTGKTTTLVQAILETSRRERRVLVCAPSNTAVDLLTEKLILRGVKVVRLGNPSRVSDLLLEHTLDARVMTHTSYAGLHAMRQTAQQHKESANEPIRDFGFQERQRKQWLKQEARTLSQAADDLERFIIGDVLESVQIITCTLVGASNRHIRDLNFDTVFIDEAAQALEPSCWIPIAKGQRIVLAGDHHQLPPTVKSEQAAREGLRETLFEKCIQRQPLTARMLMVQYRMHSDIMNFSSNRFYGGQLVPHASVYHAGLEAYDSRFSGDLPVEFIDTSGSGFWEEAIPESRSTANPREANVLLARLTQLLGPYETAVRSDSLGNSPVNQHGHAPLTIGVIAPYRAQINYLKDAIESNAVLSDLLLQRRLSVGTVDSFQGQERDIIAISLTRSNLNGEIGFLSDVRRMNVGMTRAKRKLLLVGDSSTLCRHPFFADLLAYIKRLKK
jgi:superfamily I DNA and/or RNA helicase